MSDDSLSAGELRRRYAAGGTLPDNELSAAQLRARHNVASNPKEWSTGEGGNGSPLSALAMAFISVCLLVAVAYLMWRSGTPPKA